MSGQPPLSLGDSGPPVASLQASLGLPADGEFGPLTQAGVQGFQTAAGLSADGVVGPQTWGAVDELDTRMLEGSEGLPEATITAIVDLALASPALTYSWRDRGAAPEGYIVGMALTYGLAVQEYLLDNPVMVEIAGAATTNTEKDALAWYSDIFTSANMDNSRDGLDTLRHLFVLLIGLGMRESSGQYYEGKDASASNTTSDTCEAGLFQTSWNIKSCSSLMGTLYDEYVYDPHGFLDQFSAGLTPTSAGLRNYGSGQGATYQWLAKFAPAFAALTTALGLRKLRQHWGPINRKEAQVVGSVDQLLLQVQILLETLEPEPPVPVPPALPIVTVDLTVPDGVGITLKVNGEILLLNGKVTL